MTNKSKLVALLVVTLSCVAGTAAYAGIFYPTPTLFVSKPVQPESRILPEGAARVPFTRIDLSARGADIVVERITVVRTGMANDRIFEEIFILDDEGEEVGGEGKTLNSEGTAHFTEQFVIPRGVTLRLTVAANIAEDLDEFAGQTPALTITDIAASATLRIK